MSLQKILASAALTAGVGAFLIAPRRAPEELSAPFSGLNIAHRGLHGDGVPENSLAAFELAAGAGYGIELDVRLTRDGRAVVFHDADALRMCGLDRTIESMSLSELKNLRLLSTAERIPTLDEALGAIRRRVPVVIELKRCRESRDLCKRTLAAVRKYGGEVCVESFDPLILWWFRINAPDLLRGQLSASAEELRDGAHPAVAFALSRLLMNFISRPNFIAYSVEKPKPLSARLSESMGAMRVGWTSSEEGNEKGLDAVIFEGYRPDTHFR